MWLQRVDRWSLGLSGCVTVVARADPMVVAERFGSTTPSPVDLPADDDGREPSSGQFSAGFARLADGAVIVVEPNGFQGARRVVLAAVSKKGAAASIQWGINGETFFTGARNGQVRVAADLCVDADINALPTRLKHLLDPDPEGPGLIACGAAMVGQFLQTAFCEADVLNVGAFHELVPVLADLEDPYLVRMTLEHEVPELLSAIQALEPGPARQLAGWAAARAARVANIDDIPEIAEVIRHLVDDRDSPVDVEPLMASAQAFDREVAKAERADPLKNFAAGMPARGLEHGWAWQRANAFAAIRYALEPNPTYAALGSVNCALGCASIDGTSNVMAAAVATALGTNPPSWDDGTAVAPGPASAEDRRQALLHQQQRIEADDPNRRYLIT